MKIADTIRERQDIKEMTRRAIKLLIACGENADDLKVEFEKMYCEVV